MVEKVCDIHTQIKRGCRKSLNHFLNAPRQVDSEKNISFSASRLCLLAVFMLHVNSFHAFPLVSLSLDSVVIGGRYNTLLSLYHRHKRLSA